jgi:hypothetical protein
MLGSQLTLARAGWNYHVHAGLRDMATRRLSCGYLAMVPHSVTTLLSWVEAVLATSHYEMPGHRITVVSIGTSLNHHLGLHGMAIAHCYSRAGFLL